MATGKEQSLHVLDRSAVLSTELRCPEYSFKLEVNPWQHPCLDKNIHHLAALIIALSNTCGGLIYLVANDPQTKIPSKVVGIFHSRLMELLPEAKISFIDVLLRSTKESIWTAIHLKKSEETVKYIPWQRESDANPFKFGTDLYGKICIEDKSAHQQQPDMTTLQQTSGQDVAAFQTSSGQEVVGFQATSGQEVVGFQATSGQEVASIQQTPFQEVADIQKTSGQEGPGEISVGTSNETADSDLEEQGPGNKSIITSSSGTEKSPDPSMVDFSGYGSLDWDRNKKDWESYVRVNTPTVESIVASCSLWKATRPMTVTPDKETLQRYFDCEIDIAEILSAVDTIEPGFCIVCKTWKFHTSSDESEPLPPGHVCDILTVSQHGRVTLWVVCHGLDFTTQFQYLMITGRMIKYQLVHHTVGDVSNICIECHLLFPNASGSLCDAVRIANLDESLEMQNKIWRVCDGPVNFECLQRALAMVILTKESPLKRQVGDQTTITLSEQQAKLLLYKGKVNYVTGPAGSGKSYTAAFIYKMYGRENSVYICTTKEFQEYLRFCGYVGTLVQSDIDLFREYQNGAFENKTCVIIDDSHNFACTKLSLKKLFKLLRDNRTMSLFVFADNDYQSFDRQRQQAMRNYIRELSLQVLGKEPHYSYLTAIYRNTQKVMSFVQCAIQDSCEDHQKIECGNIETGDGIECIEMPNIWENSPDNDLVVYLRNICMSETYDRREIAVLLDPSYTSDQLEECRTILREQLHGTGIQSARVFPRRGVIVDSVGSFVGLDSTLCVFILSHKIQSSIPRKKRSQSGKVDIYNPHFKVFMATRATHKALFVLPVLVAEIVKQLNFDQFKVSFVSC